MLRKIKQELKEGKVLLTFTSLQATGQVLGMIAPLIIAKFFSPALFGSYSLAKLIVFFFLTILISSAQTPFVVSANQEKADSGKINRSFSIQLLFMAAALCIFAAAAVTMSKPLARFAEIENTELLFVCLAFVGFAMQSFLVNLFLAMGQRIKSSLVELVFGILTVGLVMVFHWAGALSLKNVFFIHFVSAVAVIPMFILVVDFDKLRPFTVDRKYFKDMFNFTKWVILGSIAAYCIGWGDSLVLRVFNKPLGDIGTYNLGYDIFKGILTLTLIINTYFLPFVSQHIDNSEKVRVYLYRKRPRILLLGVVGIGLLFVVSPYFFKIVYGDVYQESATVLRVLLFGSVLILYSIFYDPLFHATRRYKFTQTLNIVQAIVNLTLDCLLVPRMGLLGAAVGAVSGYFCRAVTMEIYFRAKLKKALNV